jgi:hypothetical protein
MTEHLGLLPLDERVKAMAEIDRKAAEYEQNERDKAELARVQGQRAELEEHLTERGRRYIDATGSRPTEATLATWRDEYASEREREHQADNRRRHDEAAARDSIF